MNTDSLKFLDLLVKSDGDMEAAKHEFQNALTLDLINKAGGKDADADLVSAIQDTVATKLKRLLPEIGNEFIAHGRKLGGKVKNFHKT